MEEREERTSPARGGADKVVRREEDKVKFDSGSCDALSKASLKCLEELGYDRQAASTVCKPHYDAYRECRKQQNEAKRIANAENTKSWRWF